jgi:glycosyltransferase involved in cell wall biosynthesis
VTQTLHGRFGFCSLGRSGTTKGSKCSWRRLTCWRVCLVLSGTTASSCLPGRGEAALEQLVRECGGRNPRVTVEIGFVTSERRTRLYGDADCVLLPYTELKAQSGVLHDAYASRLPVIASGVGGAGRRSQEPCNGMGCTTQ